MLLSCTVLLHETVLNVNKAVYIHCLSGKATTGKLKEFAKLFRSSADIFYNNLMVLIKDLYTSSWR
jgi:hypothetical protein